RRILSRLVGGSNESHVSRLRPIVARINELEAHYQSLSDDEIRAEMVQLRAEILEDAAPSEPNQDEREHPERERRRELRRDREKLDDARLQVVLDEPLPEVFAAAREVSNRKLAMRPFDVQLMGAV